MVVSRSDMGAVWDEVYGWVGDGDVDDGWGICSCFVCFAY